MFLWDLLTYSVKVLEKLLTALRYDSRVPILVLCDISLIILLQDIATFVAMACRKNEDIEKNFLGFKFLTQ